MRDQAENAKNNDKEAEDDEKKEKESENSPKADEFTFDSQKVNLSFKSSCNEYCIFFTASWSR